MKDVINKSREQSRVLVKIENLHKSFGSNHVLRGISTEIREGEVVAVFAFAIGNEPTYKTIYEGEWLNDEPYAYIHRIAVKKHGMGIVDFCFSECFKMHRNLKIDTHRDNIPMQKVLLRGGFQLCGVIYLESGDERLAYQKI